MSWEDRPSFRMDLGRIWDWEKQKLTVDVDMRPTSGLRRPDEGAEQEEEMSHSLHQESMTQAPIAESLDTSLTTEQSNLNSRFLLRGRKQPYQRLLEQKMSAVLDAPDGGGVRVNAKDLDLRGAAQSGFRSRSGRSSRRTAPRGTSGSKAKKSTAEETAPPVEPFFEKLAYSGDVFSSNLSDDTFDGLLYKSRGRKKTELAKLRNPPQLPATEIGVREALGGLRGGREPGPLSSVSDVPAAAGADDEGVLAPATSTPAPFDSAMAANVWKERCAETLANWARAPEGVGSGWDDSSSGATSSSSSAARAALRAQRQMMVREGALEALARLAGATPSTPRLQSAVARTILYLADEIDIAKQQVQMSMQDSLSKICTSALTDIADKALRNAVLADAIAALCLLTRLRSPRAEEEDNGAVQDPLSPTLFDVESSLTLPKQVSKGMTAARSCVNVLQKVILEVPEVSLLGLRVLFNLTVVNHAYEGIERVVRAVVAISSSSNSMGLPEKQICVAALANLSHVLAWRQLPSRMVDEPVVDAVGHLSRRSDFFTKQLCCAVLANLAEHTPSDLTRKGGGQLCIHMAEDAAVQVFGPASARRMKVDTNPALMERLHWAATCIFRLVQARDCRIAIVKQGAIGALNRTAAVADHFDKVWQGTVTTVAQTLLLLASDERTKQLIMDKGAVPVLIRLAKSRVTQTREACTLALCALLSLKESVVYIMQQGAVGALVRLSLSESEDTRFLCASVIFNLSHETTTGELLVREGFVPAMMNLVRAQRHATLELVTGTLRNLARVASNRDQLVSDGVLGPIVAVMLGQNKALLALGSKQGEDRQVVLDCIENCVAIVVALSWCENGVKVLTTEPLVADVLAFMLCAHLPKGVRKLLCIALLNLLSHTAVVPLLVRFDALKAVTSFARVDDKVVRRRCAAMLCLISCHPDTDRLAMVRAGVVPLIANLSDAAPHGEEQQIHCAGTLANIAIDDKAACAMIVETARETTGDNDGADVPMEDTEDEPFSFSGSSSSNVVQLLMMMALVRASSFETKMACTKTLLSMLTADTLERLLDQGLLQLLTSLAHTHVPSGSDTSEDKDVVVDAARLRALAEQSLILCAQGFEILVTTKLGRDCVCKNRRALLSLFGRPNPILGPSVAERSESMKKKEQRKRLGEQGTESDEQEQERPATTGGGLVFRTTNPKALSMLARAMVQLLLDDASWERTLHADAVLSLSPLVAAGLASTQKDIATAFFLLATHALGRSALLETTPTPPVNGRVSGRRCIPLCAFLTLMRFDTADARLACARALSTLTFYPDCVVPLLTARASDGANILEILCDSERGLVCGRTAANGTGGVVAEIQRSGDVETTVETLCCYLSALASFANIEHEDTKSKMLRAGSVSTVRVLFDALSQPEIANSAALHSFGGKSHAMRVVARTLHFLSWVADIQASPLLQHSQSKGSNESASSGKHGWQHLKESRVLAVLVEQDIQHLARERIDQLSSLISVPENRVVELLCTLASSAVESEDQVINDIAEGVLLDVAVVMANLALVGKDMRHDICVRGGLHALTTVAPRAQSPETLWRTAAAIHYLAKDARNHEMMADSGAVQILLGMCLSPVEGADPCGPVQQRWKMRGGVLPETLHESAAALCCMTYNQQLCEAIVNAGAMTLLIKLVDCSPAADAHEERLAKTMMCCNIAYANLSAAMPVIDNGLVTAFLQMMGAHSFDPQAGDGITFLEYEPEESSVPTNLRLEGKDGFGTDDSTADSARYALGILRPHGADVGDDDPLAQQLWEQLERDKKEMAAPQGAVTHPEDLSELVVLEARELKTSFQSNLTDADDDGTTVELQPPRFGKVLDSSSKLQAGTT